MKRLAILTATALFFLLPTTVTAAECQFVFGFKTIRDLIGHDIVGECLENERYAANGNSEKHTTGGLLVWRKADNWTAFTDGYRTWVNGPNGLVQRLNSERFEWEADYAPGGGIATPTPTPIPGATITPIPTIAPSPTPTPAPVFGSSLAKRASVSAWYRDGLNDDESLAFTFLKQIDSYNSKLAKVLLGWAWIFDEDMRPDEASVISSIGSLDLVAAAFVPHLVALPWIADGIDRWEREAVEHLHYIAHRVDLDFATELATAPWVVDGLTLIESRYGISLMQEMLTWPHNRHSGPEFARLVLNLIPYPPKEADLFLVYAMRDIAGNSPDGLERLMTTPWFLDGLDERERVFLIAAGGARLDSDQLFDPYSTASSTIVLPHKGAVNVWVVHNLSSRVGRVVLADLERAVRRSEKFWELPFPVDDVILAVFDG